MNNDAGMVIPSSPSSETSSSSSDIDTESTCSFFRDRSTTLGMLMGVSLADGEDQPQETAEEEERGTPPAPVPEEEGWRWRRRWRPRRGSSWWRMCRDDVGGTTPLAHFLRMERQLSRAGLLCGTGGEATAPLFENGRVLPSSSAAPVGEERAKWKLRRSTQGQGSLSLARLPVLLTGICSGGA
uniref:Uncharacterized protein n=1 Tax=Avena sativa TaxID=4498 RepID=A0ACD5YQN3_AVESA